MSSQTTIATIVQMTGFLLAIVLRDHTWFMNLKKLFPERLEKNKTDIPFGFL